MKPADAANEWRNVLEPPTRLSESMIWKLQAAFYQENSVDAFTSDEAVPSFITR